MKQKKENTRTRVETTFFLKSMRCVDEYVELERDPAVGVLPILDYVVFRPDKYHTFFDLVVLGAEGIILLMVLWYIVAGRVSRCPFSPQFHATLLQDKSLHVRVCNLCSSPLLSVRVHKRDHHGTDVHASVVCSSAQPERTEHTHTRARDDVYGAARERPSTSPLPDGRGYPRRQVRVRSQHVLVRVFRQTRHGAAHAQPLLVPRGVRDELRGEGGGTSCDSLVLTHGFGEKRRLVSTSLRC